MAYAQHRTHLNANSLLASIQYGVSFLYNYLALQLLFSQLILHYKNMNGLVLAMNKDDICSGI